MGVPSLVGPFFRETKKKWGWNKRKKVAEIPVDWGKQCYGVCEGRK